MARSISPAALAVLQGMQHRWPPQFPPRRTLLTDHGQRELDVPADRAAWTGEHWQQYALHLERAGAQLADDVRKLRQRVAVLQSTSRGRRRGDLFPNWLAPDWAPKRRPGAPIAESTRMAMRILHMRAEISCSTGRELTDREAIAEWNSRSRRAERVAESERKAVAEAMRRVQKAPQKYRRALR